MKTTIYKKILGMLAAATLALPMQIQAASAAQSPSAWHSIRTYTQKKLNQPLFNNETTKAHNQPILSSQINTLQILSLGVALAAHQTKTAESAIASGVNATLHAFASPHGKFVTTLIKSFALHMAMSYITGGLSTLYPGFLNYGMSTPANCLRYLFKDIFIHGLIVRPAIAIPINYAVDTVNAALYPAPTQTPKAETTDQSSRDQKKKKKKKRKKPDTQAALAYLNTIQQNKKP